MQHKFKVGDIVEIIDSYDGDELLNGDVCTITRIDNDDSHYLERICNCKGSKIPRFTLLRQFELYRGIKESSNELKGQVVDVDSRDIAQELEDEVMKQMDAPYIQSLIVAGDNTMETIGVMCYVKAIVLLLEKELNKK